MNVKYLQKKASPKRSSRSLKGLCADLKIQITEEDIVQVLLEM